MLRKLFKGRNYMRKYDIWIGYNFQNKERIVSSRKLYEEIRYYITVIMGTGQLGKPKFDRFHSNNFPCKQNHVISSRFFASWFPMIVKELTQCTESRTTLCDLTEKLFVAALPFWCDIFRHMTEKRMSCFPMIVICKWP